MVINEKILTDYETNPRSTEEIRTLRIHATESNLAAASSDGDWKRDKQS